MFFVSARARVCTWQNHLQPNCAEACWLKRRFDGGALILHGTVRVVINLNVTKAKRSVWSKALIYYMPLIKTWLILIKVLLNQVVYHPRTLIIFHWFFFPSAFLPGGYFALFADKVKQTATITAASTSCRAGNAPPILRIKWKKTFEAGHSSLKLPDSGVLTARHHRNAGSLLQSTLGNVSEKRLQWISR